MGANGETPQPGPRILEHILMFQVRAFNNGMLQCEPRQDQWGYQYVRAVLGKEPYCLAHYC